MSYCLNKKAVTSAGGGGTVAADPCPGDSHRRKHNKGSEESWGETRRFCVIRHRPELLVSGNPFFFPRHFTSRGTLLGKHSPGVVFNSPSLPITTEFVLILGGIDHMCASQMNATIYTKP